MTPDARETPDSTSSTSSTDSTSSSGEASPRRPDVCGSTFVAGVSRCGDGAAVEASGLPLDVEGREGA